MRMKAITHERYGGELAMTERPRPEPGDGEVLIRVRAAGVDAGVVHLVKGEPYLIRPVLGWRAPRNKVRGSDLAGVVEAVGAGVREFRAGDAVFGVCDAAFAEYAVAKQDKLAAKPEEIGFEEAAAIPSSGVTALQAVRGRIAAGQHVLVTGAGGGVGSFAVQLAKDLGAEVTGVCGPGKADLVRSLGAAHVIDYTREDVTAGSRRYDLIVDVAGNRPLSRLRRILTPRGHLVIVGGEGGGKWLSGLQRQLRAALLNPFSGQGLHALFAVTRAEDLRELAALAASGRVRPVIGRTYPLEDAAKAVGEVAGGHGRGKTVLTVGAS
ncbi:NAD(P)-dependent alcohol dehydrogenase [Nonomuraea sp. NPDC050790]|uniref:NAD(P)-dependent alcohol dehydrogenase n=1 Tax=Nonomuraea sp. NPDC050790 TaxID=3364371 RepID=UPI0037881E78